MTRKIILYSLAAAALASTGPALARGAPGAAAGGTLGLGVNAGAGTDTTGGIGSTVRDEARINSQGPTNASATGIAHANANSVLSGTSTSTSTNASMRTTTKHRHR